MGGVRSSPGVTCNACGSEPGWSGKEDARLEAGITGSQANLARGIVPQQPNLPHPLDRERHTGP